MHLLSREGSSNKNCSYSGRKAKRHVNKTWHQRGRSRTLTFLRRWWTPQSFTISLFLSARALLMEPLAVVISCNHTHTVCTSSIFFSNFSSLVVWSQTVDVVHNSSHYFNCTTGNVLPDWEKCPRSPRLDQYEREERERRRGKEKREKERE